MLKKLALMSAVSAFALGSAFAQNATPPAKAPEMQKTDTMNTGATAGGAQFVASQKPDQFLASKFKGTDVVGSDDQKIGDVSDLLFDKDGKIEAYVISVGGFLGIGSKDVALAPSAFQVMPGDPNSATNSSPKLKISMTKEQLKEAANFEPHKPPRATTGSTGTSSRPAPGGGMGGGVK
jgi:sporulation protein YlmC with PRC-barrel domain